MCGIVGYAGGKRAVSVLLDTLSGLEYRGYDSAGVSVFDGDGIVTVKAKGRLQNLADRLKAEHPGWRRLRASGTPAGPPTGSPPT